MPPSINLSEAAKLKDVEFRLRQPYLGWINATLQTARSKNLGQITIHFPCFFINLINETTPLEWQELDHLLVQLWTRCSIRPVLTHENGQGTDPALVVAKLLPELTSRGFYVFECCQRSE